MQQTVNTFSEFCKSLLYFHLCAKLNSPACKKLFAEGQLCFCYSGSIATSGANVTKESGGVN